MVDFQNTIKAILISTRKRGFMKQRAWKCPRCQQSTFDFPAISRRDNETEICSQCGVDEAMADYHGIPDNWLEKAENGPSESP